MGNSGNGQRKFLRLNVNLESFLDNETKGVMKTLSLGGCLIEMATPMQINNPVCIKIFWEGESFKLWGDVLCSPKETSHSIRFKHPGNFQNPWLINMIETIQKTSAPQRRTRVSLQANTLLDQKPALITNISEGGGFIQTSASFNYNDIAELEFRIKEEKMHLVGQVRRVEPIGIGIEFLSPEPTQIGTISRYISLKTSSS